MLKFFSSLFLIFSSLLFLPLLDVAPTRNSGDCQLNASLYANVPPPVESCNEGKKEGDACETRFEGKKGKCKKICMEGDRSKCSEPNPLTVLECQEITEQK